MASMGILRRDMMGGVGLEGRSGSEDCEVALLPSLARRRLLWRLGKNLLSPFVSFAICSFGVPHTQLSSATVYLVKEEGIVALMTVDCAFHLRQVPSEEPLMIGAPTRLTASLPEKVFAACGPLHSFRDPCSCSWF